MKTLFPILLLLSSGIALAKENAPAKTQPKTTTAAEQDDSSIKVLMSVVGSYESLKGSASSDTAMTGYGIALRGGIGFEEVAGLTPTARLGIKYLSVGHLYKYKPLPSVTQDITTDTSSTAIELDAGLQKELTTNVALGLNVGYSQNLSGQQKITDKRGTIEEKSEKKLKALNSVQAGLSGDYRVTPSFSLGFEGVYKFSGRMEVQDSAAKTFSGYTASFVSQFSL